MIVAFVIAISAIANTPPPPKKEIQRDSNLRPPAIGSNPVEAQKFCRAYLQFLKMQLPLRRSFIH